MFSNKSHINLLTVMLTHYGVKDFVVCPGSRNAPIVHNLHQVAQQGEITLHGVTDERSAGFVALGISATKNAPVCICVTSGSSVLGLKPAVAEAYYRNIPLLVVSADRPKAWIDQLDGQTIHQEVALSPYASCFDVDEHFALNDMTCVLQKAFDTFVEQRMPMQINLRINEPLFAFTQPSLESYKAELAPQIQERCKAINEVQVNEIFNQIAQADRPLLVMGHSDVFEPLLFEPLKQKMALLPEIISNAQESTHAAYLEEKLRQTRDFGYVPDVVVHLGGALVHKQIKLWLRECQGVRVFRFSDINLTADTFGHLCESVALSTTQALRLLAALPDKPHCHKRFIKSIYEDLHAPSTPESLEASAVKIIAKHLSACAHSVGALNLANSMSVRLASKYIEGGRFPVFCNRGINGIEGTLSHAVGSALAQSKMVVTLIGDLSFFYDVNALWNSELKGNLRILLLNNQGGQIFHHLPGLSHSSALQNYIAAAHDFSAQGVAQSFKCAYRKATNLLDLDDAICWLLNTDFQRPAILEIITP
ncbi:MAG: 2-succinyl-5-enolpyruvyl-6-hydroxy-3-cyclohexene-1-carboxylic-acid synthase [Bacteroidaceae bacterium]|nr:2-succinyl-5-enolpyruvyl-6-hydroxy-3-cyclohexene-1-carboxylic-acid synthase [Bacteroidaceae bacterium]